MGQLSKWLMEENKFFSRLTDSKNSNMSVVMLFAGIVLLVASFILANSASHSESRLVQGLLLVFSIFFFAPIVSDVSSKND